jgi:hypothetical protein
MHKNKKLNNQEIIMFDFTEEKPVISISTAMPDQDDDSTSGDDDDPPPGG